MLREKKIVARREGETRIERVLVPHIYRLENQEGVSQL
jgi:hypothetical protein